MPALEYITSLKTFSRPSAELMHLFWSRILRRIATVFLWLFSPVYIYKTLTNIGFSMEIAIVLVVVFFLFFQSAKLAGLIFSENFSQKGGFKGTIKLSFIPFFFYVLCLVLASKFPLLFIPAAILWGLHNALFWWGYHGYFLKVADNKHFGESMGQVNVLETLVTIITPIAGGVWITYFGFNSLFLLSAAFMAVALFVLGKDHDKRQRRDIFFSQVVKLIRNHKSVSLAYFGLAAEGYLYAIVWPIFLSVFWGGILTLGKVVTLATLLASIFSLLAGKWTDQKGEKMPVVYGTFLVFISWLVRATSINVGGFVAADTLRNFGVGMVDVPLNVLTYRKAEDGGMGAAILFRETAYVFGAIFALLLYVILILAGIKIQSFFVLGGIFSLLPYVSVIRKRLE